MSLIRQYFLNDQPRYIETEFISGAQILGRSRIDHTERYDVLLLNGDLPPDIIPPGGTVRLDRPRQFKLQPKTEREP